MGTQKGFGPTGVSVGSEPELPGWPDDVGRIAGAVRVGPGSYGGVYRAIGIPLEDSEHEGGPVHAAANVGGVHVAVYAAAPNEANLGKAPRWEAPASSLPGFWVDDLHHAVGAVEALGATVLIEHEDREWGCRAVVSDPDGRSVELNQRDHCGDAG